jgi:hypothetical protein
MATVLKSVTTFANLAIGVPTALPHGLVDAYGQGLVPDHCEDNHVDVVILGADATNVTVRNDGLAPVTVNVLCEHWHSENRALPAGQANLPVQPFVPSSGGVPFNAVLANLGTDAHAEYIPFGILAGGGGLAQSAEFVYDGGSLGIGPGASDPWTGPQTWLGVGFLYQENDLGNVLHVNMQAGASVATIYTQNAALGLMLQWWYVSADTVNEQIFRSNSSDILIHAGATSADHYIEMANGDTVAVSPGGKGRLRYNTGTNKWQVSENGGAWTNII